MCLVTWLNEASHCRSCGAHHSNCKCENGPRGVDAPRPTSDDPASACVCGGNDWIREDPYGKSYANGYALCGHCARPNTKRGQADAPRPTSESINSDEGDPMNWHRSPPTSDEDDFVMSTEPITREQIEAFLSQWGPYREAVARVTDLEAQVERERALRDAGEAQADSEIVAKLVAAEAQVAALTANATENARLAMVAEAQVAALTLAAGETDGAGSNDAAAVTSTAASNIDALRRCLKNPTLIYSTRAEEKLDALAAQVAALAQEHDECKALGLVGWRERARDAEAALATTRQALAQIAENAEAWHGPEGLDSGHARALGVIGTAARRALEATEEQT